MGTHRSMAALESLGSQIIRTLSCYEIYLFLLRKGILSCNVTPSLPLPPSSPSSPSSFISLLNSPQKYNVFKQEILSKIMTGTRRARRGEREIK